MSADLGLVLIVALCGWWSAHRARNRWHIEQACKRQRREWGH
jgi:hypothetical protein